MTHRQLAGMVTLGFAVLFAGCAAPGRYVASRDQEATVRMHNGEAVPVMTRDSITVSVRILNRGYHTYRGLLVSYTNNSGREVTVEPEQLSLLCLEYGDLIALKPVPRAHVLKEMHRDASWAAFGNFLSAVGEVTSATQSTDRQIQARQESDDAEKRSQKASSTYDRARDELAGTTTLAPGETYSGVVMLPNQRYKQATVEVPVEKNTYTFKFEWARY